MRKFLPLVLAIAGLLAGGGAGWALRPADSPPPTSLMSRFSPPPQGTETIRLPNQFVIPLFVSGRVQSMVVISLALELVAGHGVSFQQQEARLRAIFLQAMFDHANIGGFDGIFTSGEALLSLRRILLDAARLELGDRIHDVLITELLRQDG